MQFVSFFAGFCIAAAVKYLGRCRIHELLWWGTSFNWSKSKAKNLRSFTRLKSSARETKQTNHEQFVHHFLSYERSTKALCILTYSGSYLISKADSESSALTLDSS
ncbi:hypothetical protein K2173_003183 [Erythroxylum novogranatense]|uniref:Secreted protein n=1 Tax=Erythroxylum novogranatense TaxID=1862640 RepID=A0AAV8SY39_9ROSI|nr:hypothetical protein K2173_003183 [Erythroxylum novogranatense]